MTRIFYSFCLALITLLLHSCMNLVLKATGITDTESKYWSMTNGQKTFSYIPMHHVGTEDFYASVAQDVDSFQNAGYVVFYEGVGKNQMDSVETLHYRKKLRKIVGLNIGQYYDTTNNTFMGKFTYKGPHKLINQPSYPTLNVNMGKAYNMDIPINVIIDQYEKQHGQIKLNDCDLNTHLDAQYNCEGVSTKTRSKFLNEFVIEMRDEHLYKSIIESQYDKILIIYGRKHYKGIKNKLISHDNSWKELK